MCHLGSSLQRLQLDQTLIRTEPFNLNAPLQNALLCEFELYFSANYDRVVDAGMIAYNSLNMFIGKTRVCCTSKPCVRVSSARRVCVRQSLQKNPLVLESDNSFISPSRNGELDVHKGGFFSIGVALLVTV